VIPIAIIWGKHLLKEKYHTMPVEIISTITAELAAEGADAVVLMGSYARGDASPYSDIDLVVLGEGRDRYECRAGVLIVAHWLDAATVRQGFTNVTAVGSEIPGWREAKILFDRQGIAAQLQREADAWTWAAVDAAACDRYVARELAGLAEEVQKLAGALQRGAQLTAAVQRNVLVLRMAGIMAVHQRLLYGTENRLWDLMAAQLGDPWASLQAQAMGLDGEPFAQTCRAALDLYAQTAYAARSVLDDQQIQIVEQACRWAGCTLKLREGA
jgi:predicted nucleotidyltransferase